MRALPNMTVIAPSNFFEVTQSIEAILNYKSPCYLRLGIGNEATDLLNYKIGKANVLSTGSDIIIIATGSMVGVSFKAVNRLNKIGVEPILINMHTIKPLDADTILSYAKLANTIITVEEHSIIGGLGSAVAEVIADNYLMTKLKRMGINDKFCVQVASQSELLKLNGLTEDDVMREVLSCL